MDQYTQRQIHGASELLTETIDGVTGLIAETHLAMIRQQYELLGQIPVIGGPAYLIGRIQYGITSNVYCAVRIVNHVTGVAATQFLEHRWPTINREGIDDQEDSAS
jgi:hypothetical protein